MKTTLPATFTEYWRGKGNLPKEAEQKEIRPEELGKEWRELIEAIQVAAKTEWPLNKS